MEKMVFRLDNETVEDKTWSSKKTSDEIAKKVDKSYVDDNFATMDKVVKQVVVDARAFENVASAWTSKIYPHVKQGGCYMLSIMTKGGIPHILMLSTEIGTEGAEGTGFFVEWGGGTHACRFDGTEFTYF